MVMIVLGGRFEADAQQTSTSPNVGGEFPHDDLSTVMYMDVSFTHLLIRG